MKALREREKSKRSASFFKVSFKAHLSTVHSRRDGTKTMLTVILGRESVQQIKGVKKHKNTLSGPCWRKYRIHFNQTILEFPINL